jgi:hypothetical protein
MKAKLSTFYHSLYRSFILGFVVEIIYYYYWFRYHLGKRKYQIRLIYIFYYMAIEKKTCSKCRNEIYLTETFCSYCGEKQLPTIYYHPSPTNNPVNIPAARGTSLGSQLGYIIPRAFVLLIVTTLLFNYSNGLFDGVSDTPNQESSTPSSSDEKEQTQTPTEEPEPIQEEESFVSFTRTGTMKLMPIEQGNAYQSIPDLPWFKKWRADGDTPVPEVLLIVSDYQYENYTAFLKFDLEEVPVKENITQAVLYMLPFSVVKESDVGVYYCSKKDWSRETLTWNNKPDYVDIPMVKTRIYDDVVGWYAWDVIDHCQIEINNGDESEIMTLALVNEGIHTGPGTSGGISYSDLFNPFGVVMLEGGTSPAFIPFLEISWTEGVKIPN